MCHTFKFIAAALLLGGLFILAGCSKPRRDDGTKSFQGTWYLFRDGQKTDREAVFENDQVRIEHVGVITGPSAPSGAIVLEPSVFQVNASPTPGQIDFVTLRGTNQGKTRAGIFAFDGDDRLKICMADFGGPRPTDFVANQGTTLLVLELKK